jgi:hypothetical protein
MKKNVKKLINDKLDVREQIARILARESGHGEDDWEENWYLDIADEILSVIKEGT